MNILHYAQQMEKDGEKYYRELAEKCGNKGLRTILLGMADDEVKHCRIFEEMEAQSDPDMVSTEILVSAKNIFQQMRGEGGEFAPDCDQVDAYRKAREIELKSEAFYREKAEEVESPAHKELFNRIADEEKKHAFLLENVIHFVTRPDTWMENAEFHHLEDY